MNILHRQLSYRIIGCAMHVHRELGPGLDETFYHRALYNRMLAIGIPCLYKPLRQLIHKGILADTFEADLIVGDSVALELKTLGGAFSPSHYTQLISYLKCWRLNLGVLLDFGKESLVQKRIVFTERDLHINALSPESLRPSIPRDRDLFLHILASLRSIADEYGLGYRDTTYHGIFKADLTAEAIPIEQREVNIRFDGDSLGPALQKCFVVDDCGAVKLLALYDRLHAMHRAILQAEMRRLGLRWGVLANFGKKSLDWQYIQF